MAKYLKGAKPIGANKWQSNEVRLLAKAANERMRQLEKSGVYSPAYEAVQAKLEAMGVKKTSRGGRRFSETGKGTFNQLEALRKVVNDFMSMKTSTPKKAAEVAEAIWQAADKGNKLSERNITKEQWGELWRTLPEKKKDRAYGSTVYVEILDTVLRLQNEPIEKYDFSEYSDEDRARYRDIIENKLSVDEIAKLIEESGDVKTAYANLGIKWVDVRETKKILGKL